MVSVSAAVMTILTSATNIHIYLLGITSITVVRSLLYSGRVVPLIILTIFNHLLAYLLILFLRKEELTSIPTMGSTLFFQVIFIMFSFAGANIRYKLTRENYINSLKMEETANILEIKNRNMTDSITYAKRIQQSQLPTEQYLQRILDKKSDM
jgi:hypothetical protein